MNAYTVTASHSAFWQRLIVAADTADQAEAAFRKYLEDTATTEEYEMAQQSGIESEAEDFVYGFDADDIEDYDGDATAAVQMTKSGANG